MLRLFSIFNKEKSQSQTMSNVTANDGSIQQGQAGRDLKQTQTASDNSKTKQKITKIEVIKQLDELETAIKSSSLTQDQKDKILTYLGSAKLEADKEEADKEFVGQNLKRVNETLKTMKETSESAKSLWKTGQAVFKTIAPWLGAAAALLSL